MERVHQVSPQIAGDTCQGGGLAENVRPQNLQRFCGTYVLLGRSLTSGRSLQPSTQESRHTHSFGSPTVSDYDNAGFQTMVDIEEGLYYLSDASVHLPQVNIYHCRPGRPSTGMWAPAARKAVDLPGYYNTGQAADVSELSTVAKGIWTGRKVPAWFLSRPRSGFNQGAGFTPRVCKPASAYVHLVQLGL